MFALHNNGCYIRDKKNTGRGPSVQKFKKYDKAMTKNHNVKQSAIYSHKVLFSVCLHHSRLCYRLKSMWTTSKSYCQEGFHIELVTIIITELNEKDGVFRQNVENISVKICIRVPHQVK